MKNPLYNSVHYQKFLIMTHFSNIKLRQDMETVFVEMFKDMGIEAIRSIDILPPFKQYTEEEIQGTIKENNIDGLFVIILKGTDSDTVYTYSGYGFYSTKYDYFQFEVKLIDPRTDEVSWIATSTTTSSEAQDKMIIHSICNKIMSKFAEDFDLSYKPQYGYR